MKRRILDDVINTISYNTYKTRRIVISILNKKDTLMSMNEECRFRITDNNYADLIVDYTGDLQTVQERFEDECIHPITARHAVVYVPVERITRETVIELGYGAFPSCFGLADTTSLEASGILRIQILPTFALRGAGTLIGVLDTGVQYTNKLFQNADGTTRIVSIWDQTIDSGNYPYETFYGTEYTREQINQALSSEEPLSIVPSTDVNGHGTLMAGIAGGSLDEENDFVGVVPDAEFVVVKLKEAKNFIRNFFEIPEDATCFQETDIMQGVNYLYNVAREQGKPIAMCIGIETSQGGHDGRGGT